MRNVRLELFALLLTFLVVAGPLKTSLPPTTPPIRFAVFPAIGRGRGVTAAGRSLSSSSTGLGADSPGTPSAPHPVFCKIQKSKRAGTVAQSD